MLNVKCLTLLTLIFTLAVIMTGAHGVQAAVDSYSLGAGIGVVPDYEGSSDYEAVFVPYARVEWDNGMDLQLLGLRLKATLLRYDALVFGPVANYRFGRDDVDNSKVDRLDEVDDSFEIGVFGGFEANNWNASLELLQDVADGHDGFLMTLRGGYTWPLTDVLRLTLGAFTTYADDDYMEAYFEIDRRNAARSGLDTHDADAGFKDIGLTALARYRINETWSLQGLFRYASLLGDAKDSPVTADEGDKNQYMAGVLIVYTFGKAKERPADVEPYHF